MVLLEENLPIIIFVILLTIFLFVKRKNLSVDGTFPIFYILMYKGKFGIELMKKWSLKYKKTFMFLAKVSFVIGVIGVFISFIFMIWQLNFIYENNIESGGGLVLPIKTESGIEGSLPIFYVPFLEWIIALIVLIVVHEFAHGVISKRFKIPIKSSGFAFLGIGIPLLPAAFVEPEKKKLDKASDFEKIAVFGAGSTSNFIFGIIFLLFSLPLMSYVSDITDTTKFSFNNVSNQSDLYGKINNGEIISIDKNTNKNEFIGLLKSEEIKEFNIGIKNDLNQTKIYKINNYYDEMYERNLIGINKLNIEKNPKEGYEITHTILSKISVIFFWIWFLNIMIGFANLLPLGITDGGQILKVITNRYFKKHGNKIYGVVSITTIIILILTIWPKLLF